ncbi:transporter substrate-binding domain-containing protein [Paraglaciecola aquimarina]|uniref:Transporter substrate-binding domain-containing protein n=1 Tax=Paraglaciecola algarum TaxID=3050085 RepID=A0ABS9DDF1_9ALTE|nr:transporter substrate-binding domain-containing protein [Paraglaciecola sp. G1-23]MCF2950385.1 transporter substrate-binding domain-containing protein [Paraglaciecola sp. G1-23]
MQSHILYCAVLFILSTSFITEAKSPSVSQTKLRYSNDPAGGWVPYAITDDPSRPGIFNEIVPLLMEEANIQAKSTPLPIKRALVELHAGNLDFDLVNPEWIASHDKGNFIYSMPIIEVTEYLVSLHSTSITYVSLEDIHGELVGTVAGYYYHDDNKFNRSDFRSESEVILGLGKKRYSVAIMERAAALYWSDKHDLEISFGPIHSKGEIVLRLRKELQYLMPKINQTIIRLQKQGDIAKILSQYLD